MKEKDINRLVFQYLSGDISDQDREYLLQLCEADESLRSDIEMLKERKDLSRAWYIYNGIDLEKSRANLHKKIKQNAADTDSGVSIFSRWKYYAAAASVALLVAFGAVRYMNYTETVPPSLDADVVAAMQYQQNNVETPSTDGISASHFTAIKTKVTEHDLAPFTLTPEEAQTLLDENKIETERGKEHWLTLSDGTVVHLGNNTRIIYPEKFASHSPFGAKVMREIYLEGEAYIMVAKDKSRPFVVHTQNGDCFDYGTEFFVSSQDRKFAVALIKGDVGVVPHSQAEIRLKPGKEYEREAGAKGRVKDVDVNKYVAWNTGKYEFYDKTLAEIMDVFCRWYDVDVTYGTNITPDNIHLMGSFNRYGDIASALKAIEISAGVGIKFEDNNIIIY